MPKGGGIAVLHGDPAKDNVDVFFKVPAKSSILQAKGHDYTTTALVGGDAALAARFEHGSFATLYLSPKDYHRVHMPCTARLVQMIHVGYLFLVNPVTARGVPGLFARNERLVCVFDSPVVGSFVLALVGATIVGTMATVWHGVVDPPRVGKLREWRYEDEPLTLAQGEEMGRFPLGLTVVMPFERSAPGRGLKFEPQWAPGRTVRLGQAMAHA